MRIIIPTYRRPHAQATLHSLPRSLWPNVTLVVRPDEADIMSSLYPVDVHVLPTAVTNIKGTMNACFELAAKFEVATIVDDDMTHLNVRHKVENKFKLTRATETDYHTLFDQLTCLLKDPAVAVVQPLPQWKIPVMSCWPLMGAIHTIQWVTMTGPTAKNLQWDPSFPTNGVGCDQDLAIRLLKSGRNLVAHQGYQAYFKVMGRAPGGEQAAGRDQTAILAANRELARRYPDIAKVNPAGKLRISWKAIGPARNYNPVTETTTF